MDRAALARELTPAPRSDWNARREPTANVRRGHYRLSTATRDDEPDVRRLLKETAFPGSISVSLEREPDSLAAASIEGDVHDIIVARDRSSGAVAAVASRAVRDVFVNGEITRVGYLGQLRIDRAHRTRRDLLDEGFRFCRGIHEGGDAAFYLASVVADNEAARRLLTHRRSAWPTFVPAGTLVTLALPSDRCVRRPVSGVRIVRGAPGLMESVISCLDRNGRRYQFFPHWTADDLLSPTRTRGLSLDDFIIAMRGDRVVGCLACWDQRAFKQVRVRGYCLSLKYSRPVLNALAPVLGIPRLPPIGSSLAFAFLSHIAVDDDDAGVLIDMINAARVRASAAGLEYVAVGFAAESPFLDRIASSVRHRKYESIIYVAYWSDGERSVRQLDARIMHPELAIL